MSSPIKRVALTAPATKHLSYGLDAAPIEIDLGGRRVATGGDKGMAG